MWVKAGQLKTRRPSVETGDEAVSADEVTNGVIGVIEAHKTVIQRQLIPQSSS